MRLSSARLVATAASLAFVALPTLALAQDPSPPQSVPAPAPPVTSPSGPVVAPPSSPGGGSGTGGTVRDPGTGGAVRSPGSGGGYQAPSRAPDYGGNRFDRPSRYAPDAPGQGGSSGRPPAPPRVELPAPRIDPPGGARGYEPVAPGRTAGDPTPPGVSPPTRTPIDGPGRVGPPGRVQLPGVVGIPENPRQREFAAGEPRPGDDDDTRLLPPPITPVIGPPPVGKPVPQPPVAPRPDNPPPSYGYQPGNWRWGYRGWPFGYGYGRCSYGRPLMLEEDEYWARVTGYYPYDYGYGYGYGYGWLPLGWYDGAYGCGSYGYGGYGYGSYGYGSYGYGSYGYGLPSLAALNLLPCAVVTAGTYGGRRYTIVTMLPEFSAYGPTRLRMEIMSRLSEDGEVTLHGRGSQELHLFDGFVKQVQTRWCGPGEW